MNLKLFSLSFLLSGVGVSAFTAQPSSLASFKSSFLVSNRKQSVTSFSKKFEDADDLASFDPLNTKNMFTKDWIHEDRKNNMKNNMSTSLTPVAAAMLASSTALMVAPTAVEAAMKPIPLNTGDFNPATFKPVCPASDGLYRFAQETTQALVGPESFVEYGPLIAGGLLRVRLELCVIESFFNEAVGPFIEREGLKWVLPLHETVETFLAGTIFALASTFILVGSTKLISVIVTYGDIFLGVPCRTFGGYFFDRARGKPVTVDIGMGFFKTRIIGPGSPKDDVEETLDDIIKTADNKNLPFFIFFGAFKAIGEGSKITRDVIENIDLFVGRYLTLFATGYIGLKFLHFKVFPDFPSGLGGVVTSFDPTSIF